MRVGREALRGGEQIILWLCPLAATWSIFMDSRSRSIIRPDIFTPLKYTAFRLPQPQRRFAGLGSGSFSVDLADFIVEGPQLHLDLVLSVTIARISKQAIN